MTSESKELNNKQNNEEIGVDDSYKKLKIIRNILIILFIISLNLTYFNYLKNKSKHDVENEIALIMEEARVDLYSLGLEEYENLKRQLIQLRLEGFDIYTPKSGIPDSIKQSSKWCFIDSKGIVSLKISHTSQRIDIKDGRIIGFKGLNIKIPLTIKELDLSHSDLTTVSISNFPNLEKINFRSARLQWININNLPSLREIDVSWNEFLKELSLKDLEKLEKIYISWRMERLNLENLPSMKELDFSDSSITHLNVSNLVNLKKINMKNSSLLSLILNNLPNLEELDISRTRRNIKEISILKAYSIKRVNLRDINIDSELLYKLFYQIKGVEYLDISDNYYIKHLDLSHLDNLKYLNIKNCISLEKIILSKKIKNKINIEGSIKNKNILYN